MKLKKFLALFCVTAICMTIIAGCGREAVNPVHEDDNTAGAKMQLYVSNYEGGFGKVWLEEAAKRFEELHKDDEFSNGRKGVDIKITSSINGTAGSNFVQGLGNNTNDVFFTEDAFYYDVMAGGYALDITDVVTETLSGYGENRSVEDKMDQSLVDFFKTYVIEYAVPSLFHMRSLFDGAPIQQLFVVILYNTLVGFGSGVLMYSNAMARIPDSLIEYGKMEGISPIREFFTVVLPCIYPTLETFLIIGLSQIFTDQANLYTFFGDASHFSIQTIGYWLYTQVLDGRATMSSYPYSSAAGLVLSAITIPIVLIARHFLDKLDKEVDF